MTQNTKKKKRILVIKLSALGDFIQALGPMKAIRRHHPDAEITLLTAAPFKKLAEDCGYFDRVWVDERPRIYQFSSVLRLRKNLVNGNFDRVYDLQNNDRTSFYFRLFPLKGRPEWVGVAKGASHRNASPDRSAGHAFDGHRQTLALAGIENVEIDDLSWMRSDIQKYKLSASYALMVVGSSPAHPEKRWPAAHFATLAMMLHEQGMTPVILGTHAEKSVTKRVHDLFSHCVDLTGKTDLYDIAGLARGAALAVGNDTGPTHIIAATGCPTIALFSGYTSPVKHAPKGANVRILRKDEIAHVQVEDVFNVAREMRRTF